MGHNGLSTSVRKWSTFWRKAVQMWRAILLYKDPWELDSSSYLNIQADPYSGSVSAVPTHQRLWKQFQPSPISLQVKWLSKCQATVPPHGLTPFVQSQLGTGLHQISLDLFGKWTTPMFKVKKIISKVTQSDLMLLSERASEYINFWIENMEQPPKEKVTGTETVRLRQVLPQPGSIRP